MGRKHSEQTKQKISSALTGRTLSETHIENMSKARKGQIPWCIGKHLTKEHKTHISEAKETWSEQDLSFLRNNYHSMHWKELCAHLKKGRQYITTKANKLGLRKTKDAIKLSRGEHSLGKSWGSHTEHHKQHMSKLVTKKLENGEITMPRCHIGWKGSKLETIYHNILQSLGLKENVDYFSNKRIKTLKTVRYPDFLIKNLIVEIDGEYWHKDKEKDRLREIELKQLGFAIHRFTGTQVTKKEKWVKDQTIEILHSIGMDVGN